MQLSGKGDVESFSVERCRMFCGDPRLGYRNPALQIVSSSLTHIPTHTRTRANL